MEKKQLYAIGVVVILVVVAIGAYVIVSGNDKEPTSLTDAAGNEINIPGSVKTITAAG